MPHKNKVIWENVLYIVFYLEGHGPFGEHDYDGAFCFLTFAQHSHIIHHTFEL